MRDQGRTWMSQVLTGLRVVATWGFGAWARLLFGCLVGFAVPGDVWLAIQSCLLAVHLLDRKSGRSCMSKSWAQPPLLSPTPGKPGESSKGQPSRPSKARFLSPSQLRSRRKSRRRLRLPRRLKRTTCCQPLGPGVQGSEFRVQGF